MRYLDISVSTHGCSIRYRNTIERDNGRVIIPFPENPPNLFLSLFQSLSGGLEEVLQQVLEDGKWEKMVKVDGKGKGERRKVERKSFYFIDTIIKSLEN